jgi:hypothetical protein
VDSRDLEAWVLPHLVHFLGRKHGVIREPRHWTVQIDDHPVVFEHHFLANHRPTSLNDPWSITMRGAAIIGVNFVARDKKLCSMVVANRRSAVSN